jgi:uncharacterized protein DUF6973
MTVCPIICNLRTLLRVRVIACSPRSFVLLPNRRHHAVSTFISYVKTIRDFAKSESQVLTGQDADHDGTKQNAIQHAIWSASMAMEFGYFDALRLTTAHEERPIPLGMSEDFFNSHKKMDLGKMLLAWACP